MLAALHRSPPLILTLVAVMWASNAIIGQLAVGEITPFALTLLRWVMVAGAMILLYGGQLRAHWAAIRPRLPSLSLIAIAGFTGFNTLFYIASVHTSGVNIGILQGAMPVAVLLGAFAVYGDRVSGVQAAGVAITLAGVVTVASRGDAQVLLGLAFNRGDVIMFAAALFYSAYTVALRNRPDVPGTALFTLFSIVAALAALPLAAWEAAQPGYPWPTATGWGLAVIVAIFPSCLAQLLFLRGVDMIGPGRAGVYINLVPIFAAIMAILILGEVFALYHALALAMVAGGIWLAQRAR